MPPDTIRPAIRLTSATLTRAQAHLIADRLERFFCLHPKEIAIDSGGLDASVLLPAILWGCVDINHVGRTAKRFGTRLGVVVRGDTFEFPDLIGSPTTWEPSPYILERKPTPTQEAFRTVLADLWEACRLEDEADGIDWGMSW